MSKKSIGLLILILIIIIASGLWLGKDKLMPYFFEPRETTILEGVNLDNFSKLEEKKMQNNEKENIQTVAKDLSIPWEILFLPDNSLLVTERPGNLVRIKPENKEKIKIEGVEHTGEGGLLGAALHPGFPSNNWLYLYLTTRTDQGLINRVERYKFNLEKNSLAEKETIITNIPGASYHDGGRIAFGPDNLLYITTGDAGQTQLAQDIGSRAGKILRLKDNGDIPEDNPFNNEVYSYGHRNPQGLAWDKQGNLWATEHGPSGLNSGFDEVNLIQKGGNYGWPLVKGEENREGLIAPIIQSGSEDTWAPAGLEIIENKLFFVGLRGSALYSVQVEERNLDGLTLNFKNDWGRLRICRQGPDGFLYLATSNTDGRGNPREKDDKIIKINPRGIK